MAVCGVSGHKGAVSDRERINGEAGCGGDHRSHRCRPGGGTDLPPGIPDGRMPETFSKALDLFHGGKCSPGRFQEPASRCGV